MEKLCPHCGAVLPEAAAFCPSCAQSVNKRKTVRAPKPPIWRKALWPALLGLAILGLLLGYFLYSRPRIYDDGGTAQVIYTDHDGSYRLLLSLSGSRFDPYPEMHQNAEENGDYRFPLCLFISEVGNDENAANAFMQKVASITAEYGPPADGASPVVCTRPEPNNYCTDAAAVSFVDFLGEENSAEGTWTLTMKNGDVLRLHQRLYVHLIETLDYYPEDVPMETTEDLQALIDNIAATVDSTAHVNIHLPAAIYEGSLNIEERSINLIGSTDGEARTTFTGTLRLTTGANGWINEIYDIDFVGDGQKGVGLTAAARVHVMGCHFTGWKTAVLAHGYAWVNLQYCYFEDNQVGFHYNISKTSVTHSKFTGNVFTGNDTAVLLEGVPVDIAISFPESQFSDNGTDFDNRRGQEVDLSEAVFE